MTGRILRFRSKTAPAAAAPPTEHAAPLSAAEGERFRRLVLPHLDGAYSFARYLCRDAAAAEDLVQEAFLRAYRGFAGFHGEDCRAWLFAIVRNCVFSWSRSDKARSAMFPSASSFETPPEPAPDAAEAPESPEDALIRRSDVEAVRGAIEALPEPFRETLVLRELEELPYREIAAITGAPIGTVMSRLARARQMLAAVLAAEVNDMDARA
jgi:RNA polymerase sigma-70 factor (ECF subfamily)